MINHICFKITFIIGNLKIKNFKKNMIKKIRLNLGCASRPLKNYINVDQDRLSVIKKKISEFGLK